MLSNGNRKNALEHHGAGITFAAFGSKITHLCSAQSSGKRNRSGKTTGPSNLLPKMPIQILINKKSIGSNIGVFNIIAKKPAAKKNQTYLMTTWIYRLYSLPIVGVKLLLVEDSQKRGTNFYLGWCSSKIPLWILFYLCQNCLFYLRNGHWSPEFKGVFLKWTGIT